MGSGANSFVVQSLPKASHPLGEKVRELKDLLEEKIDVRARQVLIEALFIELTEGSLRQLGVQYEWTEETRRFALVIAVVREEDGTLKARAFTKYRLIFPKHLSAKERFETLVAHGIELQKFLEAPEMYVGPYGRDVVGVEGSSWVAV